MEVERSGSLSSVVTPSKGLGRGLQSLLGANPTVSASRGGGTLPVALMQAGSSQPRREIHAQPLDELAQTQTSYCRVVLALVKRRCT